MSPPRFEAAPADPSPLGTPLKYPVSGRSAPNRFLNAAMSEGLATFDEADPSKRGIPTEQLVQLYRRWGQGEWGQIQTGNVMIDPEHLEAPGNMVVPRDAEPSGERFDMFSKLAAAAKEHGSLIVAQVGHPGRQARGSVQQHPISASDVQLKQEMFGSKFGVPRPATKEDIKAVIEGFAHTAEYLEKAGFDGIELHAAHGYLLAQFLSETTNQRTDEYGGSLENRMRLILEVTAEVRRRTSKNFILGIKINSVEFQEKGFKPEEAVQLCEALEAAGMDFVETSGGTYESFGFAHRKESSRKRENYFIEFAEVIRKAVKNMVVYTTGGFKTVGAMVDALQGVDGIGIGRAAGSEPDLAKDIIAGKVSSIIKYAMGEDEFVLQLTACSAQIRLMAKGEEPFDISNADEVARVTQLMAEGKV
ncbi:hypothetical protein MCOR27_001013 [Pyricularia oryzae]|uniref:NADH:flavin oxidoreductase/NADH oxidase N-terminal domain-containing protein n=2 Tax=Pyricularia TaxID=48558 RepID=A0ABQ8NZR3_PYRGI|nr:hypothetical protein MCOR19_011549 [Pyricularia oryzae]KAI6304417.1 hypothetical protein MCOR33_000511 [Pyricularia grisea]KAI6277818.1 hypothetical protein MCOR26_004895 [Pyricularia oryzae]KAI6288341.1 hypothetical protein MCOR27_001013 [Pyricularia oryzae]KAI6329170.1 hypothetical protein MCOR30_005734 [Pyricularia oryzae]